MEYLTYEKLNHSRSEIRLLLLNHSDEGESIDCGLLVCSLEDDLPYFALSYTWGDPDVTENILVDGKTIAVTTNPIAALKTISRRQIPNHDGDKGFIGLWVDAICINQNDVESEMLHAIKRNHFYTRRGYLGFGQEGLQKGDLVCLLQGSRVPVILRKIDDHYIHVSTCFVLGLMDGEGLELLAEENLSTQQFDIH